MLICYSQSFMCANMDKNYAKTTNRATYRPNWGHRWVHYHPQMDMGYWPVCMALQKYQMESIRCLKWRHHWSFPNNLTVGRLLLGWSLTGPDWVHFAVPLLHHNGHAFESRKMVHEVCPSIKCLLLWIYMVLIGERRFVARPTGSSKSSS
jgi:hypothetical protein